MTVDDAAFAVRCVCHDFDCYLSWFVLSIRYLSVFNPYQSQDVVSIDTAVHLFHHVAGSGTTSRG